MKTTKKLTVGEIYFLDAELKLAAELNLFFALKIAVKKSYKAIAAERAIIEELLREAQPEEMKKLIEPSQERLTEKQEKEKAEALAKLNEEFSKSEEYKQIVNGKYEVELYTIPLSEVPKDFSLQNSGLETRLKPKTPIADPAELAKWHQSLTGEIETALEFIIE